MQKFKRRLKEEPLIPLGTTPSFSLSFFLSSEFRNNQLMP